MGSSTNCSQDKPSCDCDKYWNTRNHSYSQSCSCDQYDYRDHNCKPAACGCKGQSYHAKHRDQSRSRTQLQSRSCSHGHYIHDVDNWERKRTCSPVALPCLRLNHGKSPPRAKYSPVQHQDPIVELKTTATSSQDDEAIPKNAASTKIQQAPCTTYPVPPPSPDSYNNWDGGNDDADDYNLPLMDVQIKWYNSDEDSYSSWCPKDEKYSCKRPPTIWLEQKFLCFFEGRQRGVP